jgi:hypothetical protein
MVYVKITKKIWYQNKLFRGANFVFFFALARKILVLIYKFTFQIKGPYTYEIKSAFPDVLI